jgi:hypothetical protein
MKVILSSIIAVFTRNRVILAQTHLLFLIVFFCSEILWPDFAVHASIVLLSLFHSQVLWRALWVFVFMRLRVSSVFLWWLKAYRVFRDVLA